MTEEKAASTEKKHSNSRKRKRSDSAASEKPSKLAKYSYSQQANDRAIDKLQTSQLAEQLSQEFLGENRVSNKAKGHKVSALDKKYEKTHAEKMKASMDNPADGAGGVSGPDVKLHPLMPNPEGMADNFVLPDSELTAEAMASPELAHKYKHKLSLSAKIKLEAEYKKKKELKQRMTNRNTPRPTPF